MLNSAKNESRLEVIDSFRGIAIILVILYHYTYELAFHLPIFADGYLGVQLFFMISGFVILMTLERNSTLAEFAVNRFSRIYPAFFVVVMVNFSLAHLLQIPGLEITAAKLVKNLTMAAPHFGGDWIDPVYWSLLVELKYYVLVSAFYFAFKDNFIWAWILFCVSTPLISHLSDTAGWLVISNPLAFFCAGMSYYLRFKVGSFNSEALALTAVAVFLYVFHWREAAWSEHVWVASFVILFELYLAKILAWVTLSKLHLIGLISYSLYLYHLSVAWLLLQSFPGQDVVILVIASMVSILIAIVSWKFVETSTQQAVRGQFARFFGTTDPKRRLPDS